VAKALSQFSYDEIKAVVAERYGHVASAPEQTFGFPVGRKFAESVGYEAGLLDRFPNGFSESFTGAGNPQPYVDAKPGETVLDLGCGAGLDLLFYAQKVGPTGRLFGLDLAEPMLAKASANFSALGIANVQWLHASSDAIPLNEASVDLVTANGIFNLSPDKDAVIKEVARLLKPGGRTIFAEIVLKGELPMETGPALNDWFRCIGGAMVQQAFLDRFVAHGFVHPRVLWSGRNARTGHDLSLSAVIRAEKP
jgi:SAM-dependent methyltransferase